VLWKPSAAASPSKSISSSDFGKLKAEDEKPEAEIKSLDLAPDYHTKDNRDKCKALQERRNPLTNFPTDGDN
jgi:hypothetical protein